MPRVTDGSARATDPRTGTDHVSPWFADVVWRDCRRGMCVSWMTTSTWTSSVNCGARSIPGTWTGSITPKLLVYARYDLTFPVDLSTVLVREFSKRGWPHEVVALPCGTQLGRRAVQRPRRVRAHAISAQAV